VAVWAGDIGMANDLLAPPKAPEPAPLPAVKTEREPARKADPAVTSLRVAWNLQDLTEMMGPPQLDYAAPGGPLTLDELEQIALASNPTLEQARMAVRAAQGRHVQSGLYPNPVIGYVGDEMGDEGRAGFQGGRLSQEIVTGGKLALGQSAAGHAVQSARSAWDAQRWRVLNDVRAGYYEVLMAQKTLEVNRQLVHVGDEGVQVAEKLLAAMEASKADVLQAQIEAETARLGLHQAENRRRAAWRRLAAVLGCPEMETQPLAGRLDADLPELQWEDVLAQVTAQSPELAEAWAKVQQARCEAARQCALRTPNVEVEAGVRYDNAGGYTVADVGVSLPLPIFDRNQGNIIRAQSELIATHKEVRRVELALRERLAARFEKYANAREQVDTYARTILPHAKTSLDLISTGYRQGEFGYLTLLTSQRTFFNVNLQYLAALGELWATSVDLEGMLLSGGLRAAE
jgi:cobalt-zinc-cadmium efflux system outer membrane protein